MGDDDVDSLSYFVVNWVENFVMVIDASKIVVVK